MDWIVLCSLLVAAGLAMLLERLGAPVTLDLEFKGDVKRETRWFAQYGQGACTVVVAAAVWMLDAPRRSAVVPLLVAVFGASVVAMLIKRLTSRVRPRRENAGKFLGPTLRHNNQHESFPSSHSAAAVAMSVILAILYPAGAPLFWFLAILCAVLRYIMDAHWPSDVLAGIALGYGLAHLTWWGFAM